MDKVNILKIYVIISIMNITDNEIKNEIFTQYNINIYYCPIKKHARVRNYFNR